MVNHRPALPTALARIFCLAILSTLTASTYAQRPYERHSLIRGDMPPGVAADLYRMSHPELRNYTQPVRIVVPDEARVEIGGNGTYTESFSSRVTVGMSVGPVYRLKVTNIPQNPSTELYPSIELLGKLNPPAGLENEFPIQINISQDDLEQAIEGRMVTKVIYLENPETALPHRHVEDHQPYFDVRGNEDPLRAAERLGRPMAIMRIGSRIPTNTQDDAGFDFHSPAPVMINEAPPVADGGQTLPSGSIQQSYLPPIVPAPRSQQN